MKQREISKVKHEWHTSFGEARQIVQQQSAPGAGPSTSSSSRRFGGTYATAVGRPMQTIATQTDFTWPLDSKLPVLVPSSSLTLSQTTASGSQTEVSAEPMDTPAEGAVGGHATAAPSSNIPHHNNTPHSKTQSKTVPNASKGAHSNRPAKGS